MEFQIPSAPTPNLVVVTNIAGEVTEQQLREFFAFCGEVRQFHLEKLDDGLQKALIEFTRESAARTAALLSHASLGGREIVIAQYFENLPPYTSAEDEKAAHGAHAATSSTPASQPTGPSHMTQEDKPKLSIVVELLANGYLLNDRIVEGAKSFDEKFGFSKTLQQYLVKGKEWDEKYRVSETGNKVTHDASEAAKGIAHATTEAAKGFAQTVDEKLEVQKQAKAVDEKYKVSEKIEGAKKYAEQAYTTAIASEPAQRVQSYLSFAWKTAQDTMEDAKKKAVEKNPELAKSLYPPPAISAPAPEHHDGPPETA